MAQDIIGGATSYEEQPLYEIVNDINKWINYTNERKNLILDIKSQIDSYRAWNKITDDFQLTVISTISYFDTILYDLKNIKKSLDSDSINRKEVTLLRKIGEKACDFNKEYSKTFQGERKQRFKCYTDLEFELIEELYSRGRDYFVTMQDAVNAAARLEDYMDESRVNNTINIQGNVKNSQIQQGGNNLVQTHDSQSFDYQQALKLLNEILEKHNFKDAYGSNENEAKNIIKEAIMMTENQEKPSKIKEVLKKLMPGIASNVVAEGIWYIISKIIL